MFSLPKSIQELNSRQARLCLEIEKFGKSRAGADFSSGNMLVGVSGGIDSTALLIISTLLAGKSGGRVFCAHVNHGLRESAAGDAEFVAELCAELGVRMESVRYDVRDYARSHSIGLEEAGRILRYGFYQECMDRFNADYLLLAHHLGDLCEDVVMRLIRGTGWPALSGMDAADPGRKLLRPLLFTSKDRLRSFLESVGCPWREDESNLSMQYTRNRVRHQIVPLLIEENPGFGNGIRRLKTQAELDDDFWTGEVNRILSCAEGLDSGEFFVPCSVLNKSHPALRFRVYKTILESLGNGHVLSDSLERLDSAFSGRKSGSTVQFPGSKVVIVNKNGLLFKVIKTIDRESGKV
ncbi:tRNA lysidine(34) synthetase TilS [Maridesulfovibrio sp.]|uniref:tRNA lysidine(34) synthetase TilS n=1 Tax=Maridesulfovibrio sp. TaxID=2795000 RepID=UPI002A187F79|nr:tRNA lysidine(34) synthetase TilS [Maridesulfovibrio sp.]